MKILVTGGHGQLGLALQRQSNHHALVAFSREELDIADTAQINQMIQYEKPDAVINCGAWTDVDACETDPEKALNVSGYAVGALAEATNKVGGQFVQVSTDYVFDGTKESPYLETDKPNPLSAYGKSKLLGEELAGSNALIIRTSWVMSLDGKNMLNTILRLLATDNELHFVDDQVGCPTFTVDLSLAIMTLLEKGAQGIYHVTNTDPTSWYQFACEVADAVNADQNRVHPIATSDLSPPRLAPRPRNSVLQNENLQSLGLDLLPAHSHPLLSLCEKTQNFQQNLIR